MSEEEYSKDEVTTAPEPAGEQTTEPQAADGHPTEPHAADEHTTEPQDTTRVKWEMPKPVFQQTSGYLPQGYLKQIEEVGTAAASAAGPTEASVPAPQATPAVIEPQPDISEQFVLDDVAGHPPAEAQAKSTSLRIPVIILAVLGILAFLTVFLFAVWFLFFVEPGASNNF